MTRKFEDLELGDQLMRLEGLSCRRQTVYYLVVARWYDPVRGQVIDRKRNAWVNGPGGDMVALLRIAVCGTPYGRMLGHTIRGLASNGYEFADRDQVAAGHALCANLDDGKVVGIFKNRPRRPWDGKTIIYR